VSWEEIAATGDNAKISAFYAELILHFPDLGFTLEEMAHTTQIWNHQQLAVSVVQVLVVVGVIQIGVTVPGPA
jgi:hypothetical protein